MPQVTRIEVQGLAALGARMERLKKELSTKAAWQATSAAAGVVKKAAIAAAPDYDKPHIVKDTLVQPGNLKKNIITKKISRTSLTAEYIVTVRGKKKDGYAARYGRLVEFGTINMSAQPYMRPALAKNIGDAIKAMAKKLERFLKKAGV